MAIEEEKAIEAAIQAFVKEVWGLFACEILCVLIRYYHRITTVGFKNLAGDDYLMALATVVTAAESSCGHFVVAWYKGIANNAMTEEQREAVVVGSEEYWLRVGGSKTHVAGLLLYTTQLWILKGCWCLYYARLANGVQDRRLLVKGSAIIIPLTYISCLLVAFLKCRPFYHQWQIYPDPGNNCMPAISYLQTIFVMAMNTLTDFYLMAIPLPMIWKSRLPPLKKVGLLALFSGALLEMSFGILRCVSILTVGNIDSAQSGYWSIRESFVSFVLTNLPMVWPVFRTLFGAIKETTTRSSTKESGLGDSRGYRLESYSNRSKSAKDPLALPPETKYDSEEHICRDRNDGNDSSKDDEASLDLPKGHGHDADSDDRVSVMPTGMISPRHRESGETQTKPNSNQIFVTTEYTVSQNDTHGHTMGTTSTGYAV